MALARLTRAQRLITIIAISFCFFVTEIAGEHHSETIIIDRIIIMMFERLTRGIHAKVGFSTHSLALVADAFHYVCEHLFSQRIFSYGT